MKEIEALLLADREGPLPEVPDPAYTAAIVSRRLGRPIRPIPRRQRQSDPVLLLTGLITGAGIAGGIWVGGLSLYWLAGLPLLFIPLVPILLKGAR